jgi:4-amino-4-deoxy-L-arabinose transferase-like glycosyltransferase
VIVVSVIADLLWLHRFRAGFPLVIDESRYLTFALRLSDSVSSGSINAVWNTWAAQQDFAPLLPLTSVPVFIAFGETLINGIATQLIFFAVLVLASYGIGARLSSRAGGALVALVVAATPAIIDFTRSYQFAITAAAMLAAATYALLASEGLSKRRWSIGFGVLLGLTLLARAMMVAFVPALLVAAVWLALGSGDRRRERLSNLALGTAAMLITAAVWFASSFDNVVDYLTGFGYGAQSEGFGVTESRLSIGYWTRELVQAVQQDLYLPLATLLALAIVLGLAAFKARGANRVERDGNRERAPLRERIRAWALTDTAIVLFLLLWIVLALTSSRNDGVGFRVPAIPLLVALAVAALWRIQWSWARVVLITAFIAVSVLNFAMKGDVVSAVSQQRTLSVPGFGEVPVTSGRGYIQGYVYSAFRPLHSPTDPLGEEEKGWLPAYDLVTDEILSLGHREGFEPIVGLATNEPLVNAYDFSLAARLGNDSDLSIGLLTAPAAPQSVAAYKALLDSPSAPNVLLTVSEQGVSYDALTGGTAIDQDLILGAAKSLGFRPLKTVLLPDSRVLTISWRSPGRSAR